MKERRTHTFDIQLYKKYQKKLEKLGIPVSTRLDKLIKQDYKYLGRI